MFADDNDFIFIPAFGNVLSVSFTGAVEQGSPEDNKMWCLVSASMKVNRLNFKNIYHLNKIIMTSLTYFALSQI